MKVSGEKQIQSNREFVWQSLMDPTILREVIPGCKQLEVIDEGLYQFEIELKVAAIVGRYSGKIEIVNPETPTKYSLKVEGAGPLGHMNSLVNIELGELEDGNETQMLYEGEAEVGGKVAKVGQRVLSSVANLVTSQFFNAFVKKVKQHASL
jgi:carbon monoxide dehydrogenase subunit G